MVLDFAFTVGINIDVYFTCEKKGKRKTYHKTSPPWVSFVSKLNYTTNYNQSIFNITVHSSPSYNSKICHQRHTPSSDLQLNFSSSPLSKQSHDTSTKNHSHHHKGQALVVLGAVRVKQEIPSK